MRTGADRRRGKAWNLYSLAIWYAFRRWFREQPLADRIRILGELHEENRNAIFYPKGFDAQAQAGGGVQR